jgi:hypothetical protein
MYTLLSACYQLTRSIHIHYCSSALDYPLVKPANLVQRHTSKPQHTNITTAVDLSLPAPLVSATIPAAIAAAAAAPIPANSKPALTTSTQQRQELRAQPTQANESIPCPRHSSRIRNRTSQLTCPCRLGHNPCHSRCRRRACVCHRWGCAHN